MGGLLAERLTSFYKNRWLVFVVTMWLQSWAGIGYLFGSISPVIKRSLNYNQRQLAGLGVAKDLGDCVGFVTGVLCEILPSWGALLVGSSLNFVGYGWVWLIVTGRAPALPLWAMCVLIFVGTNGETYFNTVALVSSIQNFPKSRGPVVGILKGFAGLSGAILTQIYAMIHSPDHASLIFMVAVGPTLVGIGLMFIIRPVKGHKQIRPSDDASFTFVYSVCLLLAAYLMGVMLVQDLVTLNHTTVMIFTVVLFVILLVPIFVPISTTFFSEQKASEEEALLPQPETLERGNSEVILSEVEDEKPEDVDSLPSSERKKRIAQLQSKLVQAAAVGAVRIKRRRGPRRGEDFTLAQALIKADFWLLFLSLLLGSGSGLTIIDNLGQISQSLQYENTHIFVSMISIWNFLGRVGGGYISEIVVRDYAFPRPVALAGFQLVMACGHVFIAMGWPGAMYVSTLLVGLGYGAHWSIVPAAVSELFGLRNFGALYNFFTLANPAGTLVFSSLIASRIYDYEAEQQARQGYQYQNLGSLLSSVVNAAEPPKCEGSICFFLTCVLMAGLCIMAAVLSMILVRRTKTVYASLYGKSTTRNIG
ncbi:protein NUCLEAR FUSION DEFECTIVE 4 [Neltuma alba]|uniref:protein NUCLEAR FUSION DEFECTIVE 4 n=1 Tax=Neltuma alba TaxID=207710 RepID=UPI0010A534F6|nr:protein NUCLEAR FUSION DEFECTIVE 4 [Prosopis alba]XP_028772491.1 protein NUCLEAR FUSION DEFECTIVE 4 [Prosopis alba]XP_028772492.1 protein NUCLEAR FUSION DEFECTIVE 4 [Prosopis alba]